MESLVGQQEEKRSKASKTKDPTRKQIRGSSLLLIGRFLSVGLNFVSQVLMVRYLSTNDYGAFAYALSVVAFLHGLSTLGLRRGVSRFIPIYHEREEYDKLTGTLLLIVGTIVISAILIIGAIYLWPDQVARLVNDKDQPINLLLILIFMVPVQAIDGMLIALFACFASPKAIFFRKHVVAPGLKITVVVLLILLKSNVVFLAYGYLLASALGAFVFVFLLIRLLYQQGTWQRLSLRSMNVPAKEIFSFTIPLLTSDLVTIVMHSADTLLLGYFQSTSEVAAFRAVLPAAQFNKIPMMSFAILFTPLAARLFAKGDYKGIDELYWRTAVWMSVLSFPIFALTFSLAKPLTVLLYGARYESSWIYLLLLSLGYYFNVMLGFNGLTLKVLGKVRYVVTLNIGATLINLFLVFMLIPRYGALGAALGTMAAMLVHNVFKQAGLRVSSNFHIFDWHYISFYLLIVVGAAGLFVVQFFLTRNVYVLIGLAMLVSLMVLLFSRDKLKVEQTFPELLRIPILRTILR